MGSYSKDDFEFNGATVVSEKMYQHLKEVFDEAEFEKLNLVKGQPIEVKTKDEVLELDEHVLRREKGIKKIRRKPTNISPKKKKRGR